MMKEFKDFALKGNVVDLAIGLIIGVAFSSIVSSLVDDVITPLLLKPALEAANLQDLDNYVILGAVKIGKFIAAIIKFVIVAFILFLIVKGINRFKKKEAAIIAVTPEEVILLREIRDALKK